MFYLRKVYFNWLFTQKTVIYFYNRQHIAQKTLDNERKKLYTITVSFYAFPETEPC